MIKTTAKIRVLDELLSAWTEKRKYSFQTLSPGWTPSGILHSHKIGGSSAGRRIRELRVDNGIDIECSYLHYDNHDLLITPHGTWAYRLKKESIHKAVKLMEGIKE